MRHQNVNLQLYFFRHAQSEANLRPDQIGGSNPFTPLTELGERQASALGRRLAEAGIRFDALFVSPAVRTRATADKILDHVDVDQFEIVDELIEISQGDWEGQPREALYTDANRRRMAEKHFDFAAPGGESIRDVQRRVVNWFERRVLNDPSLLATGGSGRFGFVSHGITIKSFIQHVLGSDRSLTWRFDLDNASITRFDFNERGWWIRRINDAAHTDSL